MHRDQSEACLEDLKATLVIYDKSFYLWNLLEPSALTGRLPSPRFLHRVDRLSSEG